jgi:DNA-binding CsgD family transcriptional regulator
MTALLGGPHRPTRPIDEAPLLDARVIDALREMLCLAEAGALQLSRDDEGALTAILEHAGLHCLLMVDERESDPGLSPRELQIAHLVARGATNRMIAATLEISAWTVSTHIRRIFAKLRVNSRAEMVSRLVRSNQPGSHIAR